MIDLFTLALTHGLIVLALWRLLFRDELDAEEKLAGGLKSPRKETPNATDEGPSDA